jgi:hypothetical protein
VHFPPHRTRTRRSAAARSSRASQKRFEHDDERVERVALERSCYNTPVSSLARFAAGAVAALALAGPAFAEPPQPANANPSFAPTPTAVVVWIDGGFSPRNRWLWYDGDGTARSQGMVEYERGHVRSHLDYAKVERVLANAGLCARPATAAHPPGMDMDVYHVSVRCGAAWRYFTSFGAHEAPAGEAQVAEAVRELIHIAVNLAWQTTDDGIVPPQFQGYVHPSTPPPAAAP